MSLTHRIDALERQHATTTRGGEVGGIVIPIRPLPEGYTGMGNAPLTRGREGGIPLTRGREGVMTALPLTRCGEALSTPGYTPQAARFDYRIAILPLCPLEESEEATR